MAQVGNWTERFGISKSEHEQLKVSAAANQAGSDVLRWCLMNGRISENEYLEWAMNRFEMPSVSGDYFTTPADHTSWQKVKALYDWSPSLFPLTEWNGVLLIACLEPPANFSVKQPHRFVLASARHLMLHWSTLNPVIDDSDLVTSIQPSSAPSELPDGFADMGTSAGMDFDLSASGAPEGFGGVELSQVSEDATEFGQPDNHEEEAPSEMPDGISAISPDALSGLNFGAMLEDVKPQASSPSVAKEESSFHDEITKVDEIAPLEPEAPAVVPEKPKMELKAEPPRASALKPKAPAAPAPPPVAEVKPKAAAPTPPAPVVEEPVAAPEKTAEEAEDKPRFGLSMVELRPIELAHSVDDLAALAVAHTLKIQAGALVLLFEGSNLKPWRWSDLMTTPKNKSYSSVDTNGPSIFKIVMQSKLPFHGAIAPSAINDAFFNAFYLPGGLPKLVSMVPIVANNKVLGMLMGIPKTEVNYRQGLPPMEKLAASIATRLTEIQATKAA